MPDRLPWWPPPSREPGESRLDFLLWIGRGTLAALIFAAAVLFIVGLAVGWIH